MRDICKKGIAKVQKSQLSGKYQPRITVSVSVMTYQQNMLNYCGKLADQQYNIANKHNHSILIQMLILIYIIS